MEGSPTDYPLTTRELLSIAAREVGKKVPIVGEILSAHDAVMQKVEQSRMVEFLYALEGRIFELEKKALESGKGQCMIAAVSEAVRTEARFEKIGFYANVLLSFARGVSDDSEVVEILESVKRLTVVDIEMTVRLGRSSGVATVGGVCGLLMSSKTDERIPECVQNVMPILTRLQGFGLVSIFPARSEPATGFFNPRLDSMIRQEVVLSELGRSVALALKSGPTT